MRRPCHGRRTFCMALSDFVVRAPRAHQWHHRHSGTRTDDKNSFRTCFWCSCFVHKSTRMKGAWCSAEQCWKYDSCVVFIICGHIWSTISQLSPLFVSWDNARYSRYIISSARSPIAWSAPLFQAKLNAPVYSFIRVWVRFGAACRCRCCLWCWWLAALLCYGSSCFASACFASAVRLCGHTKGGLATKSHFLLLRTHMHGTAIHPHAQSTL